MRVRVTSRDLSSLKVDLAVCFAHEGDRQPIGISDAGLRRDLGRQMKTDGFRAQAGDRLVWSANGDYAARRYLILGLGPRNDRAGEVNRIGCARAVRAAEEFSAHRVAVRLPEAPGTATPDTVRAAAEGARLGAYRFERYITDEKRRRSELSSLDLCSELGGARARNALEAARTGAGAVALARDLVNEPPSRLGPKELAAVARRESRRTGLSCTVLGRAQLQKLGMRAVLAVARGSAEEPRVVHLVYRPRGAAGRGRAGKKRVLLIGKGVTFDSGGLNLKPGDSMMDMKADMAGAGAVLAAMTALGELGCSVEVHALLGLVENMTGGAAYKPGDVLETWSGKTVEVGNTDAEGRLVMCDLLAYGAAKLKPTHVLDVATLTGACVVALGLRASGLFSRHDGLRDDLLEAAAAADEKMWPMPMYDDYLPLLQKGPADLRNVGIRWGGAITAALFLGEFVPRELPWAHLDIAGPAFTETDLPDAAVGATGAGVATLLRWLEKLGRRGG